MKAFFAVLVLFLNFSTLMAQDSDPVKKETVPQNYLPQKIYSNYQTNFKFHHDRGFYLNARLGPQWNHSIKSPKAYGVRFGSKLDLGWYIANNIALHASVWGNFLEDASLVAGGPGIAFLLDGPNMGLNLTFGVGRVFAPFSSENNFGETVLAADFSLAKYWWLSGNTSLGLSLSSGIHGLTLSTMKIGTLGWYIGLSLAFLFG